MSDYPMLISNKLHSFRNFYMQIYINCTTKVQKTAKFCTFIVQSVEQIK